MSSNSELVLSAVADGASSRGAIAEATGLDLQVVSVALTGLKDKGLVERGADGWTAIDAPAEAPASAPAATVKVRSGGGRKKAAKRARPAPSEKAARPEVAVFGEYVVMRKCDAERLLSVFDAMQRAMTP